VVGREGRLLSLGRIRLVRLHPATEAGTDAALRDARDSFGFDRDHGWTVFVARVLVEGEGAWDNPTDVIPAWVLEGRERPVEVVGQSEPR
jgi:hypothetical protein